MFGIPLPNYPQITVFSGELPLELEFISNMLRMQNKKYIPMWRTRMDDNDTRIKLVRQLLGISRVCGKHFARSHLDYRRVVAS